jgi:hypothetical protein
MAVHDWTRVDAGTFHDFHSAWITHLKEALNAGVLPAGYYAMSEQWAGRSVADVLTLEAPERPAPVREPGGSGVAVAETPPRAGRRLSPSSAARGLRRTLAVRHRSGHRVVAFVEIVSPGNKDRATHVVEFVDKAENALARGVHLLLVDLVPPGTHDPQGMHGALWERLDDEPYLLPPAKPLTLASYVAGPRPEVWIEHLAVGSSLVTMPLFLDPDHYVDVPLEETYEAALRGMPAVWRDVLERRPD